MFLVFAFVVVLLLFPDFWIPRPFFVFFCLPTSNHCCSFLFPRCARVSNKPDVDLPTQFCISLHCLAGTIANSGFDSKRNLGRVKVHLQISVMNAACLCSSRPTFASLHSIGLQVDLFVVLASVWPRLHLQLLALLFILSCFKLQPCEHQRMYPQYISQCHRRQSWRARTRTANQKLTRKLP